MEKTAQQQPDNWRVIENLSILFLYQGRYDDVIANCQRQIQVKDEEYPHRLLGYVYTHLGRFDEAIAELKRAIALESDIYELHEALARLNRIVGRSEDADAQDATADELIAGKSQYRHARLAAVRGDREGALALLKVGLAEGQVLPGKVRIDPEFAFIKDAPRFKMLVEG